MDDIRFVLTILLRTDGRYKLDARDGEQDSGEREPGAGKREVDPGRRETDRGRRAGIGTTRSA